MKYILEIYYEGECLEQRWYKSPFIPPAPGDEIYIEFENPNYTSEYGKWWQVKSRKHLLFQPKNSDWWQKEEEPLDPNVLDMQTVQLYCEPCPEKEPS